MRRSTIVTVSLLALGGVLLAEAPGTAGTGGAATTARRRPPVSVEVGPKVKKDSVAPEIVKLESYIELTAKSLDKRVQSALTKIDGTPRRMLALRTYLGRKSVKGVWAWTNKEMAAYRRSLDFRLANAEVDKVVGLFQRTYPGYQLRTTKLARSLEDQIGLWNKTKSVQVASAALMKQTLKAMKAPAYPDTATRSSLTKFQTMLKKQSVRTVPTVAVPGLSHHGQLRAYDFIIWQADKIIAGSDGASIRNQWVGGGWGNRLRQVVCSASSKFDGPLLSPNEPWHYTYIR